MRLSVDPWRRHAARAAILFVAPVLCCLIGAGAFAHLVLSTAAPAAAAGPARGAPPDHSAPADSLALEIRRLDEKLAALRQVPAGRSAKAGDEEARALAGRAAALEEELEALRRQQPEAAGTADEPADSEERLRQARERRARLEAERRGAEEDLEQQSRTYSVGALGGGAFHAQRPPVFAECDAGGILVQPEGRRLGAIPNAAESAQFLGLARAARHIVFLIRPAGIESFRRYRAIALEENGRTGEKIDVGFEPVGSDWVLVYPGQGRGSDA